MAKWRQTKARIDARLRVKLRAERAVLRLEERIERRQRLQTAAAGADCLWFADWAVAPAAVAQVTE